MQTTKKMAIFALMVLISSFFFAGAQATQPNLIANPGFESSEYSYSPEATIGIWYAYGEIATDGQIHTGAQGARVSYGSYGIQSFADGPQIGSLATFTVWLFFSSERASDFFDLQITANQESFSTASYQALLNEPINTWFQFDIKAWLLSEGATTTDQIQQIKIEQFDSQEFDASYVDDFNMQETSPSALFDWRIYFNYAMYILIIAGFVVVFAIVARAKLKQGSK